MRYEVSSSGSASSPGSDCFGSEASLSKGLRGSMELFSSLLFAFAFVGVSLFASSLRGDSCVLVSKGFPDRTSESKGFAGGSKGFEDCTEAAFARKVARASSRSSSLVSGEMSVRCAGGLRSAAAGGSGLYKMSERGGEGEMGEIKG